MSVEDLQHATKTVSPTERAHERSICHETQPHDSLTSNEIKTVYCYFQRYYLKAVDVLRKLTDEEISR